jgi:para-nitrobenzyl esterase
MPTYSFEFAGKAPWYAGLPEPTWPFGSHHLSDVAYFFDLTILEPLNAAQAHLSNEVIAHWAAFARTGNPNLGASSPYAAGHAPAPRGAHHASAPHGADHASAGYWPRTRPNDREVQSLTPSGTTRTDFFTRYGWPLTV